MKFFEIKSYYMVTDIKEHEEIKEKLLYLIEIMPKSNTPVQGWPETDWFVPAEHKREYLDYFYEIIRPYMDEMTKELKCMRWEIINGWFQAYNEKDNHPWHVHPFTNYTNVYYLNLPNNSIKTQIYDVVTNEIIDNIEVSEGQVLTLPAHIIHRSPENNGKEKKIIIAFNSNFYEVKYDKLEEK